jgi:hypothetical protein
VAFVVGDLVAHTALVPDDVRGLVAPKLVVINKIVVRNAAPYTGHENPARSDTRSACC